MSRRRYVYRQGEDGGVESFEVSPDFESRRGPSCTSEAERYGDAHTFVAGADGKPKLIDISSRTKRERFMRERGVTDPSDFKEHWAKMGAKRDAMAHGDFGNWDDAERKEAIGRAIYSNIEEQRRRDNGIR